MKAIQTITACFGLAATLTGCASTLLSDERIRSATAGTLGEPEAAVTITDRHYDGMTNTYYVAHTARGRYACTINGGSIMAAGMINPPTCNRM